MAASTEEPAYFEICDLAADARFSQLNIVEELKIAYYCGVPVYITHPLAYWSFADTLL